MTDKATSRDIEQTARRVELTDLPPSTPKGRPLLDENHELIKTIKTRLSVSVGKSTLTVKELLALREGSVVTLDKGTREPVDILLEGKLIARGELVAVGDNFGVRISEVMAS